MISPLFQKLQVFTCRSKTPALHLQFHNSSFLPAIQQQQLFACSPPTPALNMQYRSSCSSASSLRKHYRNLTISHHYSNVTATSQPQYNYSKYTNTSHQHHSNNTIYIFLLITIDLTLIRIVTTYWI